VRVTGEPEGYLEVLAHLLPEVRTTGAEVHDARVAAISIAHGVDELWSADRDFGRFSRRLRVRNPLDRAALRAPADGSKARHSPAAATSTPGATGSTPEMCRVRVVVEHNGRTR
jgi:hypothetical protein